MRDFQNKPLSKVRVSGTGIVVLICAGVLSYLPLSAQQSSTSNGGYPQTSSAPKAAPAADAPPPIPIDEIIQKFAEHEAEFKTERDNYTYTQNFVIETLGPGGDPDGRYEMTSEIVFTPEGKRYENVTYAPQSTLERITLTQEDLDDLEHVQPFVLTTTELPKYSVTYVDHEPLDELNTYVFDVAPKKIEKNQRYFQGRVWVDDKDYEIVKTNGKAVPDTKSSAYPRFETFRENIAGHYWFPTYTRSNDVLHFTNPRIDIPIHMTVRYTNYKRFGVTVKIGAPTPTKPN
jgi:hypothetical protein